MVCKIGSSSVTERMAYDYETLPQEIKKMAADQGVSRQQIDANWKAFENIFKVCGFSSLVTQIPCMSI
jgi:hypothetical protein